MRGFYNKPHLLTFVIQAAACLVLQFIYPFGGFSFGKRIIYFLAGFLRQGFQIRALRAGHFLIAGRPVIRIFYRVAPGRICFALRTIATIVVLFRFGIFYVCHTNIFSKKTQKWNQKYKPHFEVCRTLNAAVALAGSHIIVFVLRPVAFSFARLPAFLLVVQRRRIIGAIGAVLGDIILLAFLVAVRLKIVRAYFFIHLMQF
jgi:hypothetical protein